MATAAVIVGAAGALFGAGATAYSAHQAADERERKEKALKEQAQRDAEIHKQRTAAILGKQKAAYAASGVEVDEGSPLAVITETQQQAEEERKAILKNYEYREDTLTRAASRIRTSGYSSAFGTLLGGAADYASSPYAVNPFAQ